MPLQNKPDAGDGKEIRTKGIEGLLQYLLRRMDGVLGQRFPLERCYGSTHDGADLVPDLSFEYPSLDLLGDLKIAAQLGQRRVTHRILSA